MLRDPALQPLSRQHQHALALCVRIDRSSLSTAVEIDDRQREIVSLFNQEIRFHFDAEERILFPAADRFSELTVLLTDLRRDHVELRRAVDCAAAGEMNSDALSAFAALLSSHIRREERELFETMQRLMSAEELHRLGSLVEDDFRAAGLPASSCEIKP